MNHEPQTSFPPKTVLIAGVGRSGTSWLGKILDSSPHVFYKPQPDDVSRDRTIRYPSTEHVLPQRRGPRYTSVPRDIAGRINSIKRLTYGLRDGT